MALVTVPLATRSRRIAESAHGVHGAGDLIELTYDHPQRQAFVSDDETMIERAVEDTMRAAVMDIRRPGPTRRVFYVNKTDSPTFRAKFRAFIARIETKAVDVAQKGIDTVQPFLDPFAKFVEFLKHWGFLLLLLAVAVVLLALFLRVRG